MSGQFSGLKCLRNGVGIFYIQPRIDSAFKLKNNIIKELFVLAQYMLY